MEAVLPLQPHVESSRLSGLNELIIENSSDAIIAIDNSYIIRLFNKKAEKIFGYQKQEIIGKPYNLLLFSQFIENYQLSTISFPTFTNFANSNEKVFGRKKDGVEILLKISSSKFYSDGQVFFVMTIQEVINSQSKENKLLPFQKPLEEVEKKAEETLIIYPFTQKQQEPQNTLSTLFAAIEQTNESIIVLDKKGIISYVNPSFEKTSGFDSTQICYQRAKNLIGPRELKEYKKIAKILTSGNKWQGTYWTRKKDGSLYEEEATIFPVKSNKGEILNYVAVCRDITEKKRFESIIDSVDMMKNVGYIFAGIRHELGNPINSIKTSLSVLKKGINSYSQDSILIYVERALSEITRVEYLLKALKSFSMYENLKLERINLVFFMKKFSSLAKEDSEKKGIKLMLNYNSEEIFATIDQRAFHQVLLNIFSNSVDALEGRENPQIDIFLTLDEQTIKIEVVDNGIGLSESQKEKLFKPFHTFKPQGTGLGLVITRKLVTNMHASLEIESTYGVGTKVTIFLSKVS
jgi:PAS domain S-box-containing protein